MTDHDQRPVPQPPLKMRELIREYAHAEKDEGTRLTECVVRVQTEDGEELQVNSVEFLNGQLWIITEISNR